MANAQIKIHMAECGTLISTRYGGMLYASKYPNSISEEEIASYKKLGTVITSNPPPLVIQKLFKAGYLEVMHSIDDGIYLYSKNGVWD